jgi:uncharacterized ion transporter superfamily protein YfcC
MIYTVLVDGVEVYSIASGFSNLAVVLAEMGGLSESVTVQPELPEGHMELLKALLAVEMTAA